MAVVHEPLWIYCKVWVSPCSWTIRAPRMCTRHSFSITTVAADVSLLASGASAAVQEARALMGGEVMPDKESTGGY